MINDTIASISTPIGSGGIGIVRVSGNNAIEIIDKIFKSKSNKKLINVKTHTINYGYIYDYNNEMAIDEVLVMLMKGPSTFTREDIVEINCHGGVVVIQKVLELVLKNGARLAEPGEFTKRAFLNGRIDLSQAEAVIDIINAKTNLSLQTSVNQLEGKLSEKVKQLRKQLLEMIAHIEASIDYPEHDMEQLTFDKMRKGSQYLKEEIGILLETADTGKIIKEGLETVIVGKPNVGKSSLMNVLVRNQRAIVTDVPGTTRDIIEEYVNIAGIPLKIIDTAGIRETDDFVEKIGVEKSKEVIDKADLIIMMLDGSSPLTKEDKTIIDLTKDKKIIVLVNKTDLDMKLDIESLKTYVNEKNIINISAKEKIGINLIEDSIKEMFLKGSINMKDNIFVTNVRHKNALFNAKNSLNNAINTIDMMMPEDCISIDLQDCYDYLGEVTGDSLDESIIDQIFSQFCLGK